jgi:hypothetical protein
MMKYSRIEDAEEKDDEIAPDEAQAQALEQNVNPSNSKSSDERSNDASALNMKTKEYVVSIERKHQVLLAKYRNNVLTSLKSYSDKLFENPQRRYKVWQGNDVLSFCLMYLFLLLRDQATTHSF